MSKTFTVEDVAEISGLTASTVITKIRKKLLKARRPRSYSIQGSDLRDFLLKQATAAKTKRRGRPDNENS
jgi:hypothetical protein